MPPRPHGPPRTPGKGNGEGRPETDTLTVSSHATPPQPEPPRKTRSPEKTQPSQRRSRSMAANTVWLRGVFCGVLLLVLLPTSWRVAGWRFFEPGGRPGPGLPGFGAAARRGSVPWMARNPRRTRAGVRRPRGAGRCQGRRRPAVMVRASQSWAWQARMSQVHRSAAAGSRSLGRVQPRTCLELVTDYGASTGFRPRPRSRIPGIRWLASGFRWWKRIVAMARCG